MAVIVVGQEKTISALKSRIFAGKLPQSGLGSGSGSGLGFVAASAPPFVSSPLPASVLGPHAATASATSTDAMGMGRRVDGVTSRKRRPEGISGHGPTSKCERPAMPRTDSTSCPN